jgi:hypothetical protein
VHSLDLRLGAALFRMAGTAVELRLDGLNLIQGDAGLVDAAFYRIDPNVQLTSNATTGIVQLPLMANPDFGKTRVPLVPARVLRLGIQLKW